MPPEIPFQLIPAIDLRNGRIVRLAQGDPARQTTYDSDPRFQAEKFKAEGADWVHVINLSGAFGEEAKENLKALAAILTVGLKVEFGGGIRDRETIRSRLEMGVARIFLGTAAIRNPALIDWAVSKYGVDRIAVDIGVLNGQVMVKGWQEPAPLSLLEAGRRFSEQGLEWCVLTEINPDGVGLGVGVDSAVDLQKYSGLKVVVSGGVSSLDDILKARRAGLAGVIIGRALYEGKLVLANCITASKLENTI